MDCLHMYQRGYITVYDLDREQMNKGFELGIVSKKDKAFWELYFSWIELKEELDKRFGATKILKFISRKLK